MLILLGIAFLAGVITAVSPCVLPVLPIILAGSVSSGHRWRPYAIIVGLVVSFTTFTLAGAALLGALGLPEDLLRDIAIAALLFLGGHARLAPRCMARRASVRLPHSAPAGRRLERARPRLEPRARLRPMRGARPGRGDGTRRRR